MSKIKLSNGSKKRIIHTKRKPILELLHLAMQQEQSTGMQVKEIKQ